MTYPKPLSEKSLRKLYAEAGITDIESEFLHALFQSCANLYGVISVQDIYDVYEDCALHNEYPKIRRSKLMKFSGIARREEQLYYVYEINEIYSLETPKNADRQVVRKDAVVPGWYRFNCVQSINESSMNYPLYFPEDILAYRDDPASPEEIQLLHFLDQLVSSLPEVKDTFQTMKPNPYLGKPLKDFRLETVYDRDMNEMYGNRKGAEGNYWRQTVKSLETLSASERLLKEYKERYQCSDLEFTRNLHMLVDDLEEAGVVLTEDEFRMLVQKITDLHNSMHSWYMRGWAPRELHRHAPAGTPVIYFGGNIEKMISDGTYSREELVKTIEESGLKAADASKYGRS